MMRYLLLFFLLLPNVVIAKVYYWQDEQGKKHFSDRPHENAQVLAIKSTVSYSKVKRISDGDTIVLENGHRIRLLSINTPEVDGLHKRAEEGGDVAKRWLIKRLKNTRVRLEFDTEKKDKYGRLLAYVFSEDKTHLNLELVRLGLASVNLYPPSLKYAHELITAQRQAEQAQRGIWGLKAYAPKKVSAIKSGSYRGWQRIIGKVKRIKTARKYHYLSLSNNFSIKIARDADNLFPSLKSYIGQTLEVRGWIKKNKQQYSLFVRHPSAIKRLR